MPNDLLKIQICDALVAFVRQRPGLDFANYGDVSSYRSELRSIGRDKTDAETLLQAVRWRESITAGDILRASRDAFSGRLTIESIPDPRCLTCEGAGAVAHPKGPKGNREMACPACAWKQGVKLSYCTGQYWPTEYRKAVAAVCASTLWVHVREHCMPPVSDPEKGTYAYYNPNNRNPPKLVSAGEWLRLHFRKEFGSKIQRRWFN